MQLIHCSYHKCLTSYYQQVMNCLNEYEGFSYKHFKSLKSEFITDSHNFSLASVNNHSLDLTSFGLDSKISRFIRDPRDLIVSGYFYHKRGAEPWTLINGPCSEDWKGVNGNIPDGMKQDESFSSHLQNISLEDGLIAQIEFRKYHLESMREWYFDNDSNVLLLRYEDVVGNEELAFSKLFEHYEFPSNIRAELLSRVEKFSAKNRMGKAKHIRNPEPGQWKKIFTTKVTSYFNDLYSDVLEMYDYK